MDVDAEPRRERVTLTGATGYVGGRLRRVLREAGYPLRSLVRRPGSLEPAEGEEVVVGDVLEPDTLPAALEGAGVAFYLVHSLGSAGDFEAEELRGAENFARAAKAAGVRRIVYLGGLADASDGLSPHLRSRLAVGDALRAHGPQVVELRASIVIGSGSLSFEMIRALSERLPVMITPRWVDVPAQPIAVDDLLAYLREAIELELPAGESPVYEIGGRDRVSYGDLMREYARQRGLRRWMIRVPLLTPRLSSLWLGLVTPVYARVGRRLVESIRHPTVVRDGAALTAFRVRPRSMAAALRAALRREEREAAESRWFDARSSAPPAVAQRTWAGVRFRNRMADLRSIRVDAPPSAAFRPIRRIGGRTGWYACDLLWRLRGWLDLLVGGVGLRRGRRDPEELRVGDALDFWRVEAYEPDRLLRLTAEMRLPGRAWLEFAVEPDGAGSRIRQRAVFDPVGLSGLAYWYAIYPIHALIFAQMLRAIGVAAEEDAAGASRTS